MMHLRHLDRLIMSVLAGSAMSISCYGNVMPMDNGLSLAAKTENTKTVRSMKLIQASRVEGAKRSAQSKINKSSSVTETSQNKSSGQSVNVKNNPRELKGVTVTGMVQAQEHAIKIKRLAPSIEESITSVSIGQLPDITIASSLSRITGVQVQRSAGQATTVDVRGLPEVGTLINGVSFITAGNIYAIQPNYETLPSSLFAGADVIKSPTASTIGAGISGTVNLRTRKPWDLPFGWTFAGQVAAGRGTEAGKTKPNINMLLNYNGGGKWGFLVGASYSDYVHYLGTTGVSVASTGTIAGENKSSATGPLGYLTEWGSAPIPSQIHALANGGVDVNGDGKSDGAFFSPRDFGASNGLVEPKRIGLSTAFQYALGPSLTLTSRGFFTKEKMTNVGAQAFTLGVSQSAPTALPLVSRRTGAILENRFNTGKQSGDWNQHFYTVQKYNIVTGTWEGITTGSRADSIARNFDTKLKFDNGGPFSGSLQWINASAGQTSSNVLVNTTTGDGSQWNNQYNPGESLPPGIFIGPSSSGGNYAYNPNGFGPYTIDTIVDYRDSIPTVAHDTSIAKRLASESTYRFKGTFGGINRAHTGMNNLRIDLKYRFNGNVSLDAGLRNSLRSTELKTYVFAARKYAGDGATDPNGCTVRFTTADISLNGGGVPGACTAGNQIGFFRGNTLVGPLSGLSSVISSNLIDLHNPAHTPGVDAWTINPGAVKEPWRFYNAEMNGNAVQVEDPASSWGVQLHVRTLYTQANFHGDIGGKPFSGNAGIRLVRTGLRVAQNRVGGVRPYGLPQKLSGINLVDRSYTDFLPALNISIDITPKLDLRFAWSKNMMPLSLNKWGGGFSRTFEITTLPSGRTVEAVTGAASSGNPNLNPWRSTNLSASLGYYISKDSMVSINAFRIKVGSFIQNGTANVCNIADQDGVVRRCVGFTQPEQGRGSVLRGGAMDYRQQLSFLPGIWSNFGFQVNFTYAPSDTGKKDLAGHAIPFPDNSEKSGNLILWYQGKRFSAHVGANYRSRRAVFQDYAGVVGFEEYQRPTTYVDASASYDIGHGVSLYI